MLQFPYLLDFLNDFLFPFALVQKAKSFKIGDGALYELCM